MRSSIKISNSLAHTSRRFSVSGVRSGLRLAQPVWCGRIARDPYRRLATPRSDISLALNKRQWWNSIAMRAMCSSPIHIADAWCERLGISSCREIGRPMHLHGCAGKADRFAGINVGSDVLNLNISWRTKSRQR